ncbi:MAG: SDR family NAD(P)-dependent oxidoreductase, partial [Gemmatimonadetes bacterium]|nr:SDR family NAD(P)-dependent oxidoreductase [Gemmatimonadota bacterium]
MRDATAPPRPSLEGRVVLVTGGSLGIGRACAAEALDAGARVMIAARGAAALREAAAALGAGRAERVAVVVADVAEPAAVDALVAATVERFGRLDGVVHAAAVPGPIGPAMDVDPTEWLDAVRTDLFGSFLVARAAARAMRRTGGGRIVLFSGGGATFPLENQTAYGCSKAAVVRLAETLAIELAPYGIAVNSLAPGFVATRIHDATLAAGERAGANLRRVREGLAGGGVPAKVAARAA